MVIYTTYHGHIIIHYNLLCKVEMLEIAGTEQAKPVAWDSI